MPSVALLANSESGSGDAFEVERRLRSLGVEVTTHPIQDPGPALEGEIERVVVAGGDGSIGCGADLAVRAGVPLAVVPAGTANDFARALGLPQAVDDACRLAVQGTQTRPIELGRMGERPFVNVASVGLAPVAARRARDLKHRLGSLAYVVGGVRAGLTAEPARCRLTVQNGEEMFRGQVWQATIACSGAFGAGSQLDTDPGDGMLDAVVVESGSRIRLLTRALGMRTGRLHSQGGVHQWRARGFDLELEPETTLNVDGEICVQSGVVRFTVDRRPVEVVVG